MKSKTGGFTLIEMMATMAIISILATGVIPLSQVVYKRTKELELRNNLRVIRTALDEYKKFADQEIIPKSAADSGYPKTLEILVAGVDLQTQTGERKKFLRRIPRDPITEDGEWGLRSYADSHDSTIWGGQDVYDVYCLSDRQALDGTYYADW
ncbi:MAG: type II secretion system protein [Deltaproteobacteria bacterium]|jgi:general secretion pathway protein G|nr:type II secretion system protein [Deltaproteobacteria bacterium]